MFHSGEARRTRASLLSPPLDLPDLSRMIWNLKASVSSSGSRRFRWNMNSASSGTGTTEPRAVNQRGRLN